MANGHNVTIHSQGTGRDTVVIGESGEQIKNITSLDVHIGVDELTEVSLEIKGIALIVNGVVTEIRFVCPCCDYSSAHECIDPNSSMAAPTVTGPPMPGNGVTVPVTMPPDMKCWNENPTSGIKVYCDQRHHHPAYHTGVSGGVRVTWPLAAPVYSSNPCREQHPHSNDPGHVCLKHAGHVNNVGTKELHVDPTGASWAVC